MLQRTYHAVLFAMTLFIREGRLIPAARFAPLPNYVSAMIICANIPPACGMAFLCIVWGRKQHHDYLWESARTGAEERGVLEGR